MCKQKWQIVADVFDSGEGQCEGCQYMDIHYSDNYGTEVVCDLLNGPSGKPTDCPRYEEFKDDE